MSMPISVSQSISISMSMAMCPCPNPCPWPCTFTVHVQLWFTIQLMMVGNESMLDSSKSMLAGWGAPPLPASSLPPASLFPHIGIAAPPAGAGQTTWHLKVTHPNPLQQAEHIPPRSFPPLEPIVLVVFNAKSARYLVLLAGKSPC
jgi:hypothetical protein